ncbi:hypothetical protein BC939DRAFT_443931 [Gamsiella multidivaricata]|uniref:uncharacterized protein n=1 Tax=Gamsiella multidivaricata TaxID=101098 RepID=UPI00221FDBC8|nr:uncharacterized protein BC939DRAFT_443931 [Gamsiella multidivaricata]KAI7828218.1 hypothetical protein BC939DRAFT_443931 [Gamsiella multidivaricata]
MGPVRLSKQICPSTFTWQGTLDANGVLRVSKRSLGMGSTGDMRRVGDAHDLLRRAAIDAGWVTQIVERRKKRQERSKALSSIVQQPPGSHEPNELHCRLPGRVVQTEQGRVAAARPRPAESEAARQKRKATFVEEEMRQYLHLDADQRRIKEEDINAALQLKEKTKEAE